MRNKRKERARIAAGIIAVLLVVIMVLSSLSLFASAAESGIHIEGTAGINGMYKINGLTPVDLIVSNFGADFLGEIQIRIKVNADMQNEDYAVYSYPVELVNGASQKIMMDVTFTGIANEVKIFAVDERGGVAAQETLKVSAVQENGGVLAGVLSDNFEGLGYLKLMNYYDASSREDKALGARLVQMDDASAFRSLEILSNFDMILVNNYDTSRLSSEQMTMLESWVKAGGLLVLGTGANSAKVMKGLTSQITYMGLSEAQEFTMAAGADFVRVSQFNDGALLAHAINHFDAAAAYGDDSAVIMASTDKGKGKVFLCGFDLEAFPLPNNNDMQHIFHDAVYDALKLSAGNVTETSHYAVNVENVINSLPNEKNSSIGGLFLVVILYIVFIPLCYVVLKKRDKKNWGGLIILAGAVAATAAIAIMSLGSAYKNPFINGVAIVNMNENDPVADAELFFAALSPWSGNVKVAFAKEMPVKSVVESSNLYAGAAGALTQRDLYKIQFGGAPYIEFYDTASWSANNFASQRTIDLGGGILTDIYIKDGAIQGTVTNNTNMDFDDLIVIYGLSYHRYEDVKKSTVLQLEQGFERSIKSSSYDIGSGMYPQGDYGKLKGSLEKEAYRLNRLKRELLEGVLPESDEFQVYAKVSSEGTHYKMNGDRNELGNIYIYALNHGDVAEHTFLVNGQKAEENYLNIFTMQANMQFDIGEVLEFPYGMLSVNEIYSEGDFDVLNDGSVLVFKGGAYEMDFIVPEFIDVLSFEIDASSIMASSDKSMNGMEIYNFAADEWEILHFTNYTKDIEKYIDNNMILLRAGYIVEKDFVLPRIQLTGTIGGA